MQARLHSTRAARQGAPAAGTPSTGLQQAQAEAPGGRTQSSPSSSGSGDGAEGGSEGAAAYAAHTLSNRPKRYVLSPQGAANAAAASPVGCASK